MTTPNKSAALLRHWSGFSIIELMIAIALGMLITAAVLAIFLSGSRNYQQDDRVARLQENGRYALNLLAEELTMAGYYGGLYKPDRMTSTLTGDCGLTFDAYNSIVFGDNVSSSDVSTFCITDTTFRADTDVLAVKHVFGDNEPSPESGKVYLRTSGEAGTLSVSTGSAAVAPEKDWEFVPRIYFIKNIADPNNASNTIPVLAMKYLKDGSMDNEMLVVEGIENIQIEFGLNVGSYNTAGTEPNYYTPTPSASELRGAVTARIYVLARSAEPDPGYTNAKSYALGSTTIDATNDQFYRRVFSTTVSLRNPAILNRLNRDL